MKKTIRRIAAILIVSIAAAAGSLLMEGIPLFGTPDIEKIERVVVEHGDYPEEVREYRDEENIELAVGLLGFLRCSPLKGLSDDDRLIQITYILDDGTACAVAANVHTVWWNGKARALHDENAFVKICTAIFFSEK